jgi:hypothetical protein
MNESKITRNDSSFLKTLTEHIAAQPEERGFCVVFEDDLKRCWPNNLMSQEERNSEIHRFAASQGWSATILDGVFGTRAIFEKREPALPVSLAESNLEAKRTAAHKARLRLRGIRMRGARLVTTMSIGRDPAATPISNTGRRTNWFGNTKKSI